MAAPRSDLDKGGGAPAAWVPICHIRLMYDLLLEQGLPTGGVMAAAGIDANSFADPLARITRLQLFQSQQAFTILTDRRPDLWLQMGLRYRMTSDEIYGRALLTAPTLRHVTQVVDAGFELSSSYARWHPRIEQGCFIGVQVNLRTVPPEIREMQLYRDIGAGIATYAILWGKRFPFARFELELPEQKKVDLAVQTGIEFRFGCERTAMLWDPVLSEVPLPLADATMHRHWLSELRGAVASRTASSFADRVRFAITDYPLGSATMMEVARRLGVSTRTFQRRLREEGLTFRRMLHDARIEMAKQSLVEKHVPVNLLASTLGYGSLASFSHAFRRRTGMAPSRFR